MILNVCVCSEAISQTFKTWVTLLTVMMYVSSYMNYVTFLQQNCGLPYHTDYLWLTLLGWIIMCSRLPQQSSSSTWLKEVLTYFPLERFGYSAEYEEGFGGRLNKGLSMLCLVKIKMGLAPELAAALSDHCRLEHLHSKDWLCSNHSSETDFALGHCKLIVWIFCIFVLMLSSKPEQKDEDVKTDANCKTSCSRLIRQITVMLFDCAHKSISNCWLNKICPEPCRYSKWQIKKKKIALIKKNINLKKLI